MSITNYRDFRVWQLGVDLVTEVYGLTRHFPQHEVYTLTSQMRRAAISIPSNIADGQTRKHSNDSRPPIPVPRSLTLGP
ncbi:MAG: four helix bundle protein [Chloroflexi bacterium]|nr:four helix bundle protein [Chloroflexota bacterium]MDA8189274.1 four helix bundle protein [Dehalococcoidales bacterium]